MSKIKVIKAEDVQKRLDEERSIEINTMRLYIRRYLKKAQDIVAEELQKQIDKRDVVT